MHNDLEHTDSLASFRKAARVGVSLLLCVVLSFGLMPQLSFATGDDAQAAGEESAQGSGMASSESSGSGASTSSSSASSSGSAGSSSSKASTAVESGSSSASKASSSGKAAVTATGTQAVQQTEELGFAESVSIANEKDAQSFTKALKVELASKDAQIVRLDKLSKKDLEKPLTEAGIYQLGSDLKLDETLELAAPAGQAIIIDLNGYKLSVAGKLASAIDASASKGAVVIVDSSCWDARAKSKTEPAANLVFKPSGNAGEKLGLAAVRYEVSKDDAKDKDASRALLVAGLNIELDAGDSLRATNAYGVSTKYVQSYLSDSLKFGASKLIDSVSHAYAFNASDKEDLTTLDGFADAKKLSVSWDSSTDVIAPLLAAREKAEREAAQKKAAKEAAASAAQEQAAKASSSEEDEQDGVDAQSAINLASVEGEEADLSSSKERTGSDLYALWNEAGLSTSYTISKGGTYYLSADIETGAQLRVEAPGEKVTIDFAGHTLASSKYSGAAVNLVSAASVCLRGDAGDSSCLKLSGIRPQNAISSSVDKLLIENLSILVEPDGTEAGRNLASLDVKGIDIEKGALDLRNSQVVVDLSKQAYATSYSSSTPSGDPVALYLASGAGAASITSSNIVVQNSPVVVSRTSYSVGHSYGMLSNSSECASVDSSTISSTSAQGIAYGVKAKNLEFLGGESMVSTEAYEAAYGICSKAEGGIALSAPVKFEHSSYTALESADLCSASENAFVFGEGFAGSAASVLIGFSAAANDDGMRIGAFASELSDDAKQSIGSSLSNALGQEAVCSIASDASGLLIRMASEEDAAAAIVGSATTYYSSFAAALAKVENGQTIKLLRDCSVLTFDKSADADASFTLDLAGKTIGGLIVSTDAKLALCSSEGRGAIKGLTSKGNAALAYLGSGSLSVQGIDIVATSSSSSACGVYTNTKAALSFEDANISASSSKDNVYGVRSTSSGAGNLSFKGGSVKVQALTYGVGVYGVYFSSKAAMLSIEGCPVSVQGTTATVQGIHTSSALNLTGIEGVTTVSALASSPDAKIAAIYDAAAAGTVASLKDVSLAAKSSTSATSASSHWCLELGGNSSDTAWHFAGACSLQSDTATELQNSSAKLVIEDGACIAEDLWHVYTRGTDASFAQVPDASYAAKFVPAVGSAYDDCTAQARESAGAVNLVWKRAGTVTNLSSGASFDDLAEAVEAAEGGDTLQLQSDIVLKSALSLNKSLSLDANGHKLSISAGSATKSSNGSATGALVVFGTAKVVLKDSQGGGSLDCTVGASNESGALTYQGLVVSDSASLALDSLAAKVTYTGTPKDSPSVSLRGASVVGGAFTTSNGASLSVRAAAEDGSTGARELRGVWVSKNAAAVDLSADTVIDVDNNAASPVQGSSDYPDGTSQGTNASNIADLVEVKFFPNSADYQEICKIFKAQANCDSSSENDSVYKANIYYLNNFKTSSGLRVWAYSDQVADADLGKASSIVPAHIFVRSTYLTSMDAYGISMEEGSAAKVSAPASITASTGKGVACGVSGCISASSWGLDQARLKTSCSSDSFLVKASNKFNLNDYASLSGSAASQVIVYPKSASLTEVGSAKGKAEAVLDAVDGSLDISLKQAMSELQLKELLYSAMGGMVNVTFTNLHDASGAASSDVSYQVPYGSTLAATKCEQLHPADYVFDGVTYRFVGWRSSTLAQGKAYDPDYLQSKLEITSALSGVKDGSLILTAVYVPVGESEHLVVFRTENLLSACAVADGKAPNYRNASNSTSVVAPSFEDEETGYNYSFAGWSKGSSAEPIATAGETLYSLLPAASEDAVYTAKFTKEAGTVSISLTYKLLKDGEAVSNATTVGGFDWSKSVSVYAKDTVQVPERLNSKGVIYTLKGWSPRKSDVEPMYEGDFYVSGSDGWNSEKRAFYAVYEQESQLVSVSFYSSSSKLGSVDKLEATSLLSSAVKQAGIDTSKIMSPGPDYQFRGWATSPTASDIIEASRTTLNDIAGDGTALSLYALWAKKTCTVTFCDSSGNRVGSVGVGYGSTVMKSNPSFKISGLPKNFKAWVFKEGGTFDLSKSIVTSDTTVYASYTSSSASGGSSDSGSSSSGGQAGTSGATGTAGKATSQIKANLKKKKTSISGLSLAGGLAKSSLSGSSVAATLAGNSAASSDELEEVSLDDADGDEDTELAGSDSAKDSDEESVAEQMAKLGNGEVGTGTQNLAQSTAAFSAVCALAIAGVLLLIRWFLARRGRERREFAPASVKREELIRF